MNPEYGVCPFGLVEAAPVALTAETTYYSTGCIPSDTQLAMGWSAHWVPDTGSAPTGVDVLMTPQVSTSLGANGTPADCADLPGSHRLDTTAAQAYRDWVRSAVPYKIRMKFVVRDINNGGGTVQMVWMGTQSQLAANA